MTRLATFLVAAMVWLTSGDAPLAEPALLLDGRAEIADSGGGDVTWTLGLSRPVPWRLWMADGPPRVIVELTGVDLQGEVELNTTSVSVVERVKTGAETTELRAILREPLAVLSAEMQTLDDGTARLNVNLQPATADGFRAALETADAGGVPEPLVVAIDPGHGGRDPGAEFGGLKEADLVLGFAHRLRDALNSEPRINAVLTRETDAFLTLDARLTRAREAGAEVLISLHADTLEDTNAASGIVIYRLAAEARAAANERLTTRHASNDRLTDVDLSGVEDEISLALLTLSRAKTVPQARDLSEKLVGAYRGAGLVMNSRPERTGAFTVLKAADIPSLLIELGFLSTDEDLKRLTSENWQVETAQATRDALLLWMEERRLAE
ncbi:MAG: N-acetylmuramoyl-L-alanine amidase [Paracoccaceae bacterium]|nr:N-acetylmuramoyl-L-alanine amidase [Paracoccaceae bacterium]